MQANWNQLERGRLEEYIAVEWEGEVDFRRYLRDFVDDPAFFYYIYNNKLHETPPKNSGYVKIWWMPPRFLTLEGKNIKIIDAIKLSVKKAEALLLLNDFPYEPIEEPQRRRGIAIFPYVFLEPDEPFFGYFSRKILQCIANRTGKESPALEQIRDIAETLRTAAGEPPAPDTAETPDTAPVETETAGVDFPPGFEVVKKPYKLNDQGESKPMTDETLKRFIQDVLPYIKEIGAKEVPPERWELANTRGTPRPSRGENAIIRYDGIDYVIYVNEKMNRFGVKFDKTPPGKPGKPAFFYFIGKVEPS